MWNDQLNWTKTGLPSPHFSLLLSNLSLPSFLLYLSLSLFLSNTQGLQRRVRNIVCARARANCLCAWVCVCRARTHVPLPVMWEIKRDTSLKPPCGGISIWRTERSARLRSHTLSLHVCPLAAALASGKPSHCCTSANVEQLVCSRPPRMGPKEADMPQCHGRLTPSLSSSPPLMVLSGWVCPPSSPVFTSSAGAGRSVCALQCAYSLAGWRLLTVLRLSEWAWFQLHFIYVCATDWNMIIHFTFFLSFGKAGACEVCDWRGLLELFYSL